MSLVADCLQFAGSLPFKMFLILNDPSQSLCRPIMATHYS